MIERWLENDVLSALRVRRGLHLTGARQCGKTTLTQMLDLPLAKRLTLDNAGALAAALRDPVTFVDREDGKILVIDEVQKAPGILDAIKVRLDEDVSKGQYLLTGSSNLRFNKSVRDSLAGRLATIRLRTLTLAEVSGHQPSFLPKAFGGSFNQQGVLTKRDVIHQAFVGGYPEQLEFTTKERNRWVRDYINDLLMKDVRDVTEIRKTEVLKDVALWVFAHTAQMFTLEEICTRASISKQTAESYLEVLRALYIVDKIPAWSKSDYDRLGKRAKWVVSDTGIVPALLRWTEDAAFQDDKMNGKLVESWVYHELVSQADVLGDCEITHYRDKDKREIDFIIENGEGRLLGVEVKAGAHVCDADFKHLRWFARNLAKGPFVGIVLYAGKDLFSMGDNLYAVPIGYMG